MIEKLTHDEGRQTIIRGVDSPTIVVSMNIPENHRFDFRHLEMLGCVLVDKLLFEGSPE